MTVKMDVPTSGSLERIMVVIVAWKRGKEEDDLYTGKQQVFPG
jgi:hypothetical protein